jgi:two-component system phosphate regulon sensor histidine kinase PhoR
MVLSVADEGLGIGKEHLPRIFERFYRADKARSRELGGTGLGLAIVKHIAQLHGGWVEAHSEQGRGTTIRVVLPEKPCA